MPGIKTVLVTLYTDEDGVIIAEVPQLPGCQSFGATREEALINVQDAIRLYLDELAAQGKAPRDAEILQLAS